YFNELSIFIVYRGIVYLTGFSEPSTFYRAFKRWTNETPVEYRKRKQHR
ncbi:helix-turn-helix domain-containing protein, partial [Acinetobacter baumannii]